MKDILVLFVPLIVFLRHYYRTMIGLKYCINIPFCIANVGFSRIRDLGVFPRRQSRVWENKYHINQLRRSHLSRTIIAKSSNIFDVSRARLSLCSCVWEYVVTPKHINISYNIHLLQFSISFEELLTMHWLRGENLRRYIIN